MPYRRSAQLPRAEEIASAFESAIRSLVQRFRNHPYAFYTETDMHCYLYHRLYKSVFNTLYPDGDGHDTILLHKEYPTVMKYRRQQDGRLKSDPTGSRRGRFDLSIWDPAFIAGQSHRHQKVLCAAELALDECDEQSVHTANDATKLTDPGNEIKYGYLLFFVRDANKEFIRNESKIRRELNEASRRVGVVLVRVSEDSKPRPEFLGRWITRTGHSGPPTV
jgi:hypothetical protein